MVTVARLSRVNFRTFARPNQQQLPEYVYHLLAEPSTVPSRVFSSSSAVSLRCQSTSRTESRNATRISNSDPSKSEDSSQQLDAHAITVGVVRQISSLLRVGPGKAKSIIKKYIDLLDVGQKTLAHRLSHLKNEGLTLERITDHPTLLLLSQDELETRVNTLMDALRIDKACAFAFTDMEEDILQIVKVTWEAERPVLIAYSRDQNSPCVNRIQYLAEALPCKLTEAADMISCAKLYIVPMKRIHEYIGMLKDAGVTAEDLIKDPWVFRLRYAAKYNQRIKLLQSKGISPIKPWMLRAAESDFLTFVHREYEEKQLLKGHRDIKGFLRDALSCSPEEVDQVLLKAPKLKLLRPKNIHEKIELFKTIGYSPQDLVMFPRVLTRCAKKIEKRYYELQSLGHTPRMGDLFASEDKYTSFVRSFLKGYSQ